ncbi:MAG TPA: (deoxy)nucleoside triphosphate pyrophosphohydrolase [Candidatus Binatia bacterium]
MSETKIIEVVAGLIFKGGRLLACRRRADGAFPLKWEFPGGKIESGEEPSMALKRELREELEIDVDEIEEVFTHTHAYAGFSTVKLKFFRVPVYRGEIINRVFEQLRWVGVEELRRLDFLEGDRAIIEWLLSGQGSVLWKCTEL